MLLWRALLLAGCLLMWLPAFESLAPSFLPSAKANHVDRRADQFDAVELPGNLTEVWVAVNGSDWGDGSAASPFRSLDRALQTPWPRLLVWLLPGRYPPANNTGLLVCSGRVAVLKATSTLEAVLDLAYAGSFLTADAGASVYLVSLRVLRAAVPSVSPPLSLPPSPFSAGSFLTASAATVVVDGCDVAECDPPVLLAAASDCLVSRSLFLNHTTRQRGSQPASFVFATAAGASIFSIRSSSFSTALVSLSLPGASFSGAVSLSGFLSVDVSDSVFSAVSVTSTRVALFCLGALSVSDTASFSASSCLFADNSISANGLRAFPLIQGASLSLIGVSSAILTGTSFLSSRLFGNAVSARGAALFASTVGSLQLLDCDFVDCAIDLSLTIDSLVEIYGAAVGIINTTVSAVRCLFDRSSIRLQPLSRLSTGPGIIEGGVFSSSASDDSLKQTAFLDSCLFRDTFLGLDSVIFPTSISGGVIYAEQLTLTHTTILGSVIQGPPKATAMEQDGIDLQLDSLLGWQVCAASTLLGFYNVIFSRLSVSGQFKILMGLLYAGTTDLQWSNVSILDSIFDISLSTTPTLRSGLLFYLPGNPVQTFHFVHFVMRNLTITVEQVSCLICAQTAFAISDSAFEHVNLTVLNSSSQTSTQLISSIANLDILHTIFSDITIDFSSLLESPTNLIATTQGSCSLRYVTFQRITVVPSPMFSSSGFLVSLSPAISSSDSPAPGLRMLGVTVSNVTVACPPSPGNAITTASGLFYSNPSSSFHEFLGCQFHDIDYHGECVPKGGVFFLQGNSRQSTVMAVNSSFTRLRMLNTVPFLLASAQQIAAGAAIYTLFADLDIIGCKFSDIITSAQFAVGAAIFSFSASSFNLAHSSFASCHLNQSDQHGFVGGVVALQSEYGHPVHLQVSSCNFSDLVATNGPGGAIFGFCQPLRSDRPCPQSSAFITRSRFQQCEALNGGAVTLSFFDLSISLASFVGNAAASRLSYCSELSVSGSGVGGAVHLVAGSLVLEDSVFESNTATSMAGAVYVSSPSVLSVRNSSWQSNSAPGMASALLIQTSATGSLAFQTIEDSFFLGNSGAGAIGLVVVPKTVGSLLVSNSEFTNNSGTRAFQGIVGIAVNQSFEELACATGNGTGATASISLAAAEVLLSNCSLSFNQEVAVTAYWEQISEVTAGSVTLLHAMPLSICGATTDVVFDSNSYVSAVAMPLSVYNESAEAMFFVNPLSSPSMAQLSLTLDTEGTWQVIFDYVRSSECGDGNQQAFEILVLPGCASPEQSHLDETSFSSVLDVPCLSTQGQFYIVAADALGNPLVGEAHACANFSALLTSPGQPTIVGAVSWSDQQLMFEATYLAQHGGNYTLSVLLDGQPISDSPQQVLFLQPDPTQCTLDCFPANTSFTTHSSVHCVITYRDQQGSPLPFCPGSLPCTLANVSGPFAAFNASLSGIDCSTQTSSQFDWQLGSFGKYTVSAFILGAPLTPFDIVLSPPQESKSWWDRYGWYAVGAISLILLAMAVLAAWNFRRRMVQHQRLTQRYELIGVDFMNVPDSGKMFLSLLTLLEDASIKKVKWQEIEPFFGNSRLGSPASSSVEVMGEEEGEGMAWSAENLLGQGAAGTVWKAKWNGQALAVKQIHIVGHEDGQDATDFFHEIKTLASLDHPNILRFVGISVISAEFSELALLTELMECSLDKIIFASQRHYTVREASRWCLDVAQGLAYLHRCSPPIIHRDIKPENILMAKEGTAKLADFGISTFKPRSQGIRNMTQKVGTPVYFAPEVFSSDQYTERCDIYSLGVLMCEVYSGQRAYSQPPWQDMPIAKIVFLVVHEQLRPLVPPEVPPTIEYIIRETLQEDPSNRPESSEIVARLTRIITTLH